MNHAQCGKCIPHDKIEVTDLSLRKGFYPWTLNENLISTKLKWSSFT